MRNIWEDYREVERETGNGVGFLEEGWRVRGRRVGEGVLEWKGKGFIFFGDLLIVWG